MRIAMFTNTYLPAVGGIERSIDIIARRMRQEGHAVCVVAPEYDGAEQTTDEILRVPAIRQFAGSEFSINLMLPTAASEAIARFAPDVIHSHQPFLLGDSALRLARTLGVPIVYTNHTFMERYLHWFPIDLQLLRDIAETLPVAYANLVDTVIAPTPSVAAVLYARGTQTPIEIVQTGIDASFYANGDRAAFRSRHGLDSDHVVLGHLGRLNAEKNLAYLGQVAACFVAEDPARRRVLMVGSGDAVTDVQAIFAAAALTEALVLPGVLHGRDCADAYAAMDAFIFTSLTDTQGLVLSEAMAAGNPVLALDAPGARDMIVHGRTGLLFDPAITPQAFARGVSDLLCDRDRVAPMRIAARAAAREVSIPRCTAELLAVYERTIMASAATAERTLSVWDKLKTRWDVERDLLQGKLSCLVRPATPG